jgi:hypothetical protein
MHLTRRKTLAAAGAAAGFALIAGATAAAARERHPAIRAAINSLEKAKFDLEHADHDFGGHRVEAIGAIDHAIEELRTALRFDRH